ncbi:diguanylate cyclase [Micromonospora echinaurantiaca]|uniref:diguanylate cyclase n=1 Tax=Micromonospora echinaurantiaca TaxID=47857 RepID=UPI00378D6866
MIPDPATAAALVTGLSGLVAAGWSTHTAARLRRQLATARHDATHDRLTGLLNRPGLVDAWPRLAPAAPLVAVLDLDGFKPVNDLRGHAAGDLVLTVIAHRLRTAVTGAAARLGGDEFALVLVTAADLHAVRALAARIAAPMRLASGEHVSVTASIGLAPSTGDLADALARADAAMYRAKTTGTGVAVHDPARDDRTAPAADPRPAVRTRNLPAMPVEAVA